MMGQELQVIQWEKIKKMLLYLPKLYKKHKDKRINKHYKLIRRSIETILKLNPKDDYTSVVFKLYKQNSIYFYMFCFKFYLYFSILLDVFDKKNKSMFYKYN